MPRTRNRTGWLTRQAALRGARALHALSPVRRATSDELPGLEALVGERDVAAVGLTSAVDQGRVLVLAEAGAIVAAAIVGGAPARLQLLVIEPGVIAAGIAERMRNEAAWLCRSVDPSPDRASG